MNFQQFSLLIFIFSGICNLSFAKSNNNDPTRITADIIDIKRKAQTIELINHVAIKRTSDSIFANKMIIFYTEDGNNSQPTEAKNQKLSSIKKIEAYENVKIINDSLTATADKGYYSSSENIFILEDNVVVHDGNATGNGKKFIYNLETKKGHFEGEHNAKHNQNGATDNRVVVIINSEKKNKNENSKR